MPKADSVLSTQRRSAPKLPTTESLRHQAAAAIEMLLRFLDETDGFTMSECEDENEHLNLCPARSDWRAA